MAIAAGTGLGRYEIRSLLGAGGMGEVYLAQDTKLGRPSRIEFFDFATRQTTQLATLEGLRGVFVASSITVSPDERWLLYTQRNRLEIDLMLVENFR